MRDTNNELKRLDYELFFFGISLLGIINLLVILFAWDQDVRDVARIVDVLIGAIFLIDFGNRLVTAPDKLRYVLRQFGWADLLAAIPLSGFQLFRVPRMVRSSLLISHAHPMWLLRRNLDNRARSALLTVLLLLVYVMEFGSIAVIQAERRDPAANIDSAGDALWWSYVSITTVGFGDQYPITGLGRLVGIVVLTAGVGLFSVLTGFLANLFLAPRHARQIRAAAEAGANDRTRMLGELSRMLEQHERSLAELRARIAELEQDERDERSAKAHEDMPR